MNTTAYFVRSLDGKNRNNKKENLKKYIERKILDGQTFFYYELLNFYII